MLPRPQHRRWTGPPPFRVGAGHGVGLQVFFAPVEADKQQLQVLFPRPKFAQGSKQETAQQGEGMARCCRNTHPRPLVKGKARDRSGAKSRHAQEVQPLYRADHGRISAEQHEDERPLMPAGSSRRWRWPQNREGGASP